MSYPPTEAYAWIDLETTGSSTALDSIVEFAMVVTDPDLKELSRYTTLVRPTMLALHRCEDHPEVGPMHQASGLLEELLASWDVLPTPEEAAGWASASLSSLGLHEHRVQIAGSGVGHFDRRFTAAHMDSLDRWFSYAPLDTGNFRRMCLRWAPSLIPPGLSDQTGTKPHRALPDVLLHLEERRRWRRLLQFLEEWITSNPPRFYAANIRALLDGQMSVS